MHSQIEELSSIKRKLSIIIPTYNESDNIIKLIEEINSSLLTNNIEREIIVVDDNSPDGTGFIVDEYAKRVNYTIRVLHRKGKNGLASAIIDGISIAEGENILVMDADFSHPPSLIPLMLKELEHNDLVIASRYVNGGRIVGWPLKRKLLSNLAKKIAELILKIDGIKDPLSGFFGFKKSIISMTKFDGLGYKLLLEIIIKVHNASIKEIPYTFTNRKSGASKLDITTIMDYLRSIWRLYRYGRKNSNERRGSVLFLSKASRFYTIGFSGLFVNYGLSMILASFIDHNSAMLAGISASITSNFILNKLWTFEDKNFGIKRILKQYGLYLLFSSVGAFIQFMITNLLMDRVEYEIALLISVGLASIGNFLFNKKFTFKERLWS
ncbi:MAG: glycosyltransferase family 2 protein [Candidatus Nitrosocaldaceae archaeon]